MPQKPLTSYFEYWDEAPHDWPTLIQERLHRGFGEITIPILWGVHESAPGMRDFSKQSKLRIEKLFTTLQSMGVSVRIVLGFPAHKLAFPAWANHTTDFELVPGFLWHGHPPYFSLVRVPSPRSSKLLEGFISFVEEVSSILSLYLSPEGPIKNIEMSLRPLQLSQSYLSEIEYIQNLEARYNNISAFNKIFQTSYKNFASVITPMGTRLVESKRPWLYAYDYLWGRSRTVDEYLNLILKAQISEPLKKIIKLEGAEQNVAFDTGNPGVVCLESTLVEFENRSQISPIMINGHITSSSVQMFQWATMLSECAKNAQLDLMALKTLGSTIPQKSKVVSVFCGKYLSVAAARAIQDRLDAGGFLFFPTGLPQFDENLESLNWSALGARKTTKLGDRDWNVLQKNSGYIFYPKSNNDNPSQKSVQSWLNVFGAVSEGLISG